MLTNQITGNDDANCITESPSPKHETKRLVATLSTRSRSQCKRLDLVELVGGGMFATLKKETPMIRKNILFKILQALYLSLIKQHD